MTIEDLERGMKILWDGHVHSAARLDRIEALQEKAVLEMADLRTSQKKAELEMADLRSTQKNAELEMADLRSTQKNAELEMAEHRAWQADFRLSLADLRASESTMLDGLKRLARVVTNIAEAQARTDVTMAALAEDLRRLAKRMDAFIAALRNGREQQQ